VCGGAGEWRGGGEVGGGSGGGGGKEVLYLCRGQGGLDDISTDVESKAAEATAEILETEPVASMAVVVPQPPQQARLTLRLPHEERADRAAPLVGGVHVVHEAVALVRRFEHVLLLLADLVALEHDHLEWNEECQRTKEKTAECLTDRLTDPED